MYSDKIMKFAHNSPHRTSDAVLESENDPHDPKNGRRPDSMLVLRRESFLDRKDPESVSPQTG